MRGGPSDGPKQGIGRIKYLAVPVARQPAGNAAARFRAGARAAAIGPAAPVCHAGAMARAQLDKRPGDVSAMFDKVAERYDLLNDTLSLGQIGRATRLNSS